MDSLAAHPCSAGHMQHQRTHSACTHLKEYPETQSSGPGLLEGVEDSDFPVVVSRKLVKASRILRAINAVHAGDGAGLDAAVARRRTGAPVAGGPVVLRRQAKAG